MIKIVVQISVLLNYFLVTSKENVEEIIKEQAPDSLTLLHSKPFYKCN